MIDKRLPNVVTAHFYICTQPLYPDFSGLDPGFGWLINRYTETHNGFAWMDCCEGDGLRVFSYNCFQCRLTKPYQFPLPRGLIVNLRAAYNVTKKSGNFCKISKRCISNVHF
jgi:hypothetical protein